MFKRTIFCISLLVSILFFTSCLSAEKVYQIASEATVEVTTISDDFTAVGTGFFCDTTDYLITNYHVIENAQKGYITIPDGGHYDIISVIGYDKEADIALLSTSYKPKKVLKSSDKEVKTGETVYAIGSSEGLTSSFSSGIVSSASRHVDNREFIQITAPISHGNSGGPVIDKNGHVIGISTASITNGQNLNLAIPFKTVKQIEIMESVSLIDLFPRYSIDTFHSAWDYLNEITYRYGKKSTPDNLPPYWVFEYYSSDESGYFRGYAFDIKSDYKICGITWYDLFPNDVICEVQLSFDYYAPSSVKLEFTYATSGNLDNWKSARFSTNCNRISASGNNLSFDIEDRDNERNLVGSEKDFYLEKFNVCLTNAVSHLDELFSECGFDAKFTDFGFHR